MQWFVETTIVIDGVPKKAQLDVVPIVSPVLAAVGKANDLSLIFPHGTATPEPSGRRMLTISGWRPGYTRQMIMLIKAVRSWTGLDLLNAKRTVDLLDSRGSFDLDLEHPANAGMTVESLFKDLYECGVIYREVRK